jgi:hypothetical protein
MIKRIVFILLFAYQCFAADYYFSQSTGNDTTGNGSIETPWQTIAKINSTAFSAGDNVYLKAGDTWIIGSGEDGIDVDWNGTEGSLITLTSYGTGAKPIIDASAQTGDGRSTGAETEVCIHLAGSQGNYVTIDGIDLRGAVNEAAIDGYGSSIGDYFIVTNCDITGSGYSSESLITIYGGDHITISDNTLDGGGNQYNKGIEISGGSYNTISGNTVIALASFGGAIRMVHQVYPTIEKNYVYGCSVGETINWGIVYRDPYDSDSWGVIRNNLVDLTASVLTGDDIIGLNMWNATGDDATIKVFNNTFIGNGNGNGIKLYDFNSGIVIANNIFYDFNYYLEVNDNLGTGAVDFQYNAYYSCAGGADIEEAGDVIDGGNHQTGDPLLVGVDPSSATDFQIQSGSPCINAGTTKSGDAQIPSDDYWGTSRSSIDIGAHEYNEFLSTQKSGMGGGGAYPGGS